MARAMLAGTYAERLEETARAEDEPVWTRATRRAVQMRSQSSLDADETDFSPDNFSFDFGDLPTRIA